MSDDDAVKAWFQHAVDDMFPKMKSSAMTVTILAEPDPKLCLELGAAILFDKPIIVLVPEGTPIPANLKRCAVTIVQGNLQDKATQERFTQAMRDVLAKDRRAQ